VRRLAWLALLLAGCGEPPPVRELTLEPQLGYTFGGVLERGDVVLVRAERLRPTDRVRLHRCRDAACASQETLAVWRAADFAPSGSVSHPIAARAEHYFWIEDRSHPAGEQGEALQGAGERHVAGRHEATFGGRVTLTVEVARGE
jgi:hypothetical protein